MLSNLTLGQYYPGRSPLHRLDPRVKIVLLFAYLLFVFLLDKFVPYALLTALSLGLMLLSGVPLRLQLRSLKPLWWIILFTFVIHLFSHPGTELLHIWILSLTVEGLEAACFLSLRLVLLLLMSTLLTLTTSPLRLTDALEDLLSPGRRFGLPAHELAMMMTIALRFVPTLLQEADKIIKAQQSRGADLKTGNLLTRLRSFVPVLVPLFLSSFRRADELALAMEARCYRGGEGRTQMKELHVLPFDIFCAGLFVVLTVILLVLEFCL